MSSKYSWGTRKFTPGQDLSIPFPSSCPGVNFLVPQLYFDDIVAKQRLSEIDLEVELEMARSVGVIGDEESVVDWTNGGRKWQS